MKVTLLVCDKPGRKPDYSLEFELPGIPREGDYISVTRVDPSTGNPRSTKLFADRNNADAPEHIEVEAFVVKRVRWNMTYPCDGSAYAKPNSNPGTATDVFVEVVPAKSYFMHPRFKDSLPPSAPEFEWG